MSLLPTDAADGTLLGRVWNPTVDGPSVVAIRNGRVLDITSRTAPTVRDICELDNPAEYVAHAEDSDLGAVELVTFFG